MEYTLRKLDSSEFDLLVPLMRDCFGMDVDIDYFKWKYLDNPAGEFIGFIAVSANNEIGAYYGVIPEVYSIEGVQSKIYQSCDTMTHSSHRRKGLFQKLAKLCYDWLSENDRLFVIGFGGAQSTPGFIKFGWKNPFQVRHYFYPRLLSSVRGRLLVKRHRHTVREAKVEEVEHLLSLGNRSASIHSIRSAEIFRWRISNPRHAYRLLGAFSEGSAAGYACYYETDQKIFLFDHGFSSRSAGRALINELKKIMQEGKLKGIVSFCQENSNWSAELRRFGFISNPFSKGPLAEKTPFIFYANKEELERYNDAGQWLINAFDHDAL